MDIGFLKIIQKRDISVMIGDNMVTFGAGNGISTSVSQVFLVK
jgi:hypothetical protein